MALDWTYNFAWQYNYAKGWLADVQQFAPDWQKNMLELQKLMGETGFDPSVAGTLDRLRAKIDSGTSENRCADAGKNILYAVKAGDARQHAVLAMECKMRAAALKFLQHVYLMEFAGERCVWVHSLPKEFGHWASMYMHHKANTTGAAQALLATRDEHFSDEQKRSLAGATVHALAWAQRTGMVLSNAASAEAADAREEARDLVRRWFCPSGTTEVDLEKAIGILGGGFKAIVACLTQGRFILTDWVPFRGARVPPESNWLGSEAFTFPNRAEGFDVVYIEQAFFSRQGDVIKGRRNWIRVLIHELSHLVCNTRDIPAGEDGRYAWYGIGPHAGFPLADAIRNADSWAFFAADCAAVLSDAERRLALRIR